MEIIKKLFNKKESSNLNHHESNMDNLINKASNVHISDKKRCEGKVALILGASSGIGKACAIELAKNGAKAVLAARREDLLKRICFDINSKNHDSAHYIACDVLNIDQIAAVVDYTIKTFNRIDIAVNNFGVCQSEDILNLSEKSFDYMFDINTKGIAFAMKYQCLAMQKQDTLSSIINIGSTLSLVGMSNLASYSASKHAIIGLTKSAVLDRVRNVRINTICPGWIRTPMGGFPDECEKKPVENVEKDYPIGRIGEPEDIANAVVFLASDESSFINGATIPVDGGFICD